MTNTTTATTTTELNVIDSFRAIASSAIPTKITQRDYFNAIKAYFTDGTPIPAGYNVVEFCDGRIAQLDKKSASTGEAKPTARQLENDGIKAGIVANMEPGVNYQVGEMLKSFDCFGEDMTSQRVSALVKQLVDAGVLVREEIKRKAYFHLA